ncbi:TolC family protein [Bathymodiolus thermophilus thioautotrophic gill symbiont]|uniref:TolC family protein n=1 Tax=Bathymodiolus thermophilus thioautotrophic gill symbiont TaxID=2360 RepID=UPI003B5877BD
MKGSDYYPKLDFVFNYNKVFNGANDLKEESHAYGLQLNSPLYKLGYTPGKIISHNRIKRSTYNLRKVNLQVRDNWSKLINNYKNNIHLLSDIDHQYNRLKLEISRNDIIKKERIKSSDSKYKIDLLKLEKKYLH